MANIYDVASYILHQTGKITTMRLQKLMYYSQAWSLVWDDKPLFDDDFEAWSNAPIIPKLFFSYKGIFVLESDFFDNLGCKNILNKNQTETLDIVIADYNKFTNVELSSLIRKEAPWKNARKGVSVGIASNNVISKKELRQYYGGL